MHKKTISIMLCLALLLSAIVFAIPARDRVCDSGERGHR